MSNDQKIADRPFPFEVKAAILRLVGIAISTPKDVADINVDLSLAWSSQVDVKVYAGGYKSGVTAAYEKSIYLQNMAHDTAVKELEEIITSVEKATANGRKIKADRLRAEAAELMRKAGELEAIISSESQPQPAST